MANKIFVIYQPFLFKTNETEWRPFGNYCLKKRPTNLQKISRFCKFPYCISISILFLSKISQDQNPTPLYTLKCKNPTYIYQCPSTEKHIKPYVLRQDNKQNAKPYQNSFSFKIYQFFTRLSVQPWFPAVSQVITWSVQSSLLSLVWTREIHHNVLVKLGLMFHQHTALSEITRHWSPWSIQSSCEVKAFSSIYKLTLGAWPIAIHGLYLQISSNLPSHISLKKSACFWSKCDIITPVSAPQTQRDFIRSLQPHRSLLFPKAKDHIWSWTTAICGNRYYSTAVGYIAFQTI